MVPASNFFGSARLVTIISFFTYLRLALPDIAQDLQNAIKVARTKLAKPLILAYLVDLRDLLFYAIPVVCWPKCSVIINDVTGCRKCDILFVFCLHTLSLILIGQNNNQDY